MRLSLSFLIVQCKAAQTGDLLAGDGAHIARARNDANPANVQTVGGGRLTDFFLRGFDMLTTDSGAEAQGKT